MNELDELDDVEELADFVELLRCATPEPDWLGAVETQVMAETAASAAGVATSAGAMAAKGLLAILALALALGGAEDPRAKPSPGTDDGTAEVAAGPPRAPVRERASASDQSGRPAHPRRAAPSARFAGRDSFAPPRVPSEGRREAAPPARAAQQSPDPSATMTFELEDAAVPDDPSTPPSEGLATALRAYATADYLEAALAARPVIEGRTGDSRRNVAKARFFLAKSLHHLGFDHGAAIVLEEISRDPDGAYFDEALPWLAAVAERVPDDPILVEAVGRYEGSALTRVERDDEGRGRYDHLLYLMGRARYSQRRLDEAIALFGRIDRESEHWVPARFFTAVGHVRERRARPAVSAFRAVIAAVDSGRDGGIDDPERMKNLAWLSLGRVYYTAANARDDEGRVEIDGRLLGAAIDAWERIPERSEYWLDALFEASWAFFLAEEHDRALGRIHALSSPYFTDAYYPEADVVRAVILFSHCQLDAAEELTERFRRRYAGIRGALGRIARSRRAPSRAYALYDALRRGDAGLHPAVAGLIRRELDDRDLRRSVAHEGHVRAEAARAARLVDDPRTAALGAWLGQELAVVGALSLDRAGELVSTRLERLAEDLGQRLNEMDAVQLEIHTERRTGTPVGEGRAEIAIVADQEHMIWPFDGEYWRDEIPYYRARVRNRCGR